MGDNRSLKKTAFRPYKKIDAAMNFVEGESERRSTVVEGKSVSEITPTDKDVFHPTLDMNISGFGGFGDFSARDFEDLHTQEGDNGDNYLHVAEPRRLHTKGKRQFELCDTPSMNVRARLPKESKSKGTFGTFNMRELPPSKRRLNGNWSTVQLKKAIQDVDDGYSINSAARNNGIPYTSLRSHVHGGTWGEGEAKRDF